MSSDIKLTLHYKYHELARKINEILYQVDPMNIADLKDEYDPEARDIAQKAVIGRQTITVDIVKDVFDTWFTPFENIKRRMR